MPDPTTEPPPPERARTALAAARAGDLVAKGCTLRPETRAVVAVKDQPDGRPLVDLDESAPTVRELGACRVVTLSVAGPAPYRRLELTGPLVPHRSSRPGHRTFQLSPLTVRLVGVPSVLVAPADFRAARPDPVAGVATTALQRLVERRADLLAWARAHGHPDAEAVLTTGVDRYGIDLAVLADGGVEQVRLAFRGGPIGSIVQLAPALVATTRCPGLSRRPAMALRLRG